MQRCYTLFHTNRNEHFDLRPNSHGASVGTRFYLK